MNSGWIASSADGGSRPVGRVLIPLGAKWDGKRHTFEAWVSTTSALCTHWSHVHFCCSKEQKAEHSLASRIHSLLSLLKVVHKSIWIQLLSCFVNCLLGPGIRLFSSPFDTMHCLMFAAFVPLFSLSSFVLKPSISWHGIDFPICLFSPQLRGWCD